MANTTGIFIKSKYDLMKKFLVLFSLLLMIPQILSGQRFNDPGTFFFSFNPAKLIMGLINIKFEYQINPSVSLSLFSEYLVLDYAIRRENHPDFLIKTSAHYHMFGTKEYGDNNDLAWSLDVGYMFSKTNRANSSLFIGSDIGYRYLFRGSFFLNPKIGMTIPLNDTRFLPGVECLAGFPLSNK